MSDTPSPGCIAYRAFAIARQLEHEVALWGLLPPYMRDAWEAAAQAVLAQEDVRHTQQEGAMPDTPTPIELPRCLSCPAYASDTLRLPTGQILYFCEEHTPSQENTP